MAIDRRKLFESSPGQAVDLLLETPRLKNAPDRVTLFAENPVI